MCEPAGCTRRLRSSGCPRWPPEPSDFRDLLTMPGGWAAERVRQCGRRALTRTNIGAAPGAARFALTPGAARVSFPPSQNNDPLRLGSSIPRKAVQKGHFFSQVSKSHVFSSYTRRALTHDPPIPLSRRPARCHPSIELLSESHRNPEIAASVTMASMHHQANSSC